ncbi:MAG: hypothetical protein Q8P41_10625 [Pseudomonadota bacterium]|nr:hypothetical protein [Pseudomonadota bacterium]
MMLPLRSCLFQRLGLVALFVAAAPLAGAPSLVASALAAPASPVPVSLPVGQKVEDWTDSLASRGLAVSRVAGLPMAGPGVVLVDRKDYWEMTVRDRKGAEQTVNVAPCTTAEEREDLLFYASTLLGKAPEVAEPPVAVVPPPVVVTPAVTAPPPVAPPPTTTAATTPPPSKTTTTQGAGAGAVAVDPGATTTKEPVTTGAKAPPRTTGATPTSEGTGTTAAKAPARTSGATPTAEATRPAAVTPAAVTPAPGSATTLPAREDTGPGPWISAGGGIGLRAAAGPAGDLRLDGGWYLTDALRVGGGLGVRTASALPEAGDTRTMGNVDLIVEGAWSITRSKIRPYLGAHMGLGIRSFADAGTPLLTATVPILGGEVGVDIPLGATALHLAPSVRVQGDLRAIELRNETGATLLSPVEIRAGVVLVYRPG